MDKLELRALGKINLGLDVLGRRAVSYTHLDVYKRQVLDLVCS